MHTLLSSRSNLDLNYRENGKMILKVRKSLNMKHGFGLFMGLVS